ncbi:MAG: aminopeptidase [Roseburia sp.]
MNNQYKNIYKETNEQVAERLELATGRIGDIAQAADSVPEQYRTYFKEVSSFLLMLAEIGGMEERGELDQLSLEELEKKNARLYGDILPGHYEESFANPVYAKKTLGEDFGAALALLYTHIRGCIPAVHMGDLQLLVIAMELFIEVYNAMEQLAEDDDLTETVKKEVQQAVYWYFHDYSEVFQERAVRKMINPAEDFEVGIAMDSNLADPRYLYRYGLYVGENERGVAAFLGTLSEEQIQAMADTYTEGFRIGFVNGGKDLSRKKVVRIYYHVGFERMVRAAVKNFADLGLKSTVYLETTSPNKQYDYDHKEDRAYYLDKARVERNIEARRNYFEENKDLAGVFAGPAVIEVFGEVPFSPETREEAFHYNEKQQKLCVHEMSAMGQMSNQYLKGEERSFTIIAYPIPAIGSRFEEIFAETVKINTLDYKLYQEIQQKLIDVLDQADRVHITGKGANKTDLYVNVWKLAEPEKETAFENCVADVNIPVGEVFTSPVLAGTEGKLFVSQVYLNELKYINLEIDFKDGMISDYTCTNFAEEEENRKYIRDNVLMHHDTLPMGEFAIGTNTTAYRMARDFDIADKLPILIAEKTGPHFAVGDTCFSHEEDNITYNPDGKAIVARENAVSALRKVPEEQGGGMAKAYFNCHTDITIPYDELDKITAICKDGSEVDLISDGRFVLPGTEELNRPLDK